MILFKIDKNDTKIKLNDRESSNLLTTTLFQKYDCEEEIKKQYLISNKINKSSVVKKPHYNFQLKINIINYL